MDLLGYWHIGGDTPFRQRAGRVPQARAVISGPGFGVWVRSDTTEGRSQLPVTQLGVPIGAMVGSLFSPELGALNRAFTPPIDVTTLDVAALGSSARGALPWGRWCVAAVVDGGQRLLLGRDSMGHGRLFVAAHGDGVLFASTVHLLDMLSPRPLQPDWNYLATKLHSVAPLPEASPFAGVTQIKPGTVSTFTSDGCGGAARRDVGVWDPVALAGERHHDIPAEELRSVMLQCTDAWLGDTDRAWVQLSGGLDSSALLWAAHASGRRTTALHMVDSTSAAADELRYARAAADHVGVELVVIDVAQPPVVPDVVAMSGTDRLDFPSGQLVYTDLARQCAAAIAPHATLLNGIGGDQVFCVTLEQPFELHDALLNRGPRQFLRQLLQTSRLRTFPVPQLLREVARWEVARLRGRIASTVSAASFIPPTTSWVTVEPAGLEKTVEQAWQQLLGSCPIRLPAGKTRQLQAVLSAPGVLAEQDRVPGMVHVSPMWSQPLVELALRTDTTRLLTAASNRVAVREALEGKLPPEIIRRQAKGATTGWHMRTLRHNSATVERLIRSGGAVAAGVVDSAGAVAALAAAQSGVTAQMRPLLELLSVELWYRQWWPR